MSAFIFTRAGANGRSRVSLIWLGTFLPVCIGSTVGLVLAKAGVLGYPWEDPSQGSITLGDAILCAILGTFSGLGLGLGNDRWVKVLADRGLSLTLALILCLSAAVVSVGVALSIALFLW